MTSRNSPQLLVNKSSNGGAAAASTNHGIGGGPFFSLLPDELVITIFDFLPLTDIAFRLPQVGDDRISNLCKDSKFWSHIHVDDELDIYTAFNIIHMAGPRLKRLTLAVRKGVRESEMLAIMALANNPHLESLQCWQFDFTEKVMEAIGKSRSLRKVKLSGSLYRAHGEQWVRNLASNITCLKNLTVIDIEDLCFDSDNDDWVRSLADTCKLVEEVALPSWLGDQDLNYLLERWSSRLKSLSVKGLMLTDVAISNLKHCLLLEKLFVNGLKYVGRIGLHTITELSVRLQKLSITWLNCSGQDIAEAFTGKSIFNLTHMELSDCMGIDHVSIAAIVTSCPNLEEVDFMRCDNVRDREVSRILHSCKKIKRLWLTGNNVTARAFEEGDGTLRILNLLATDRQHGMEIAKVMRRCRIYTTREIFSIPITCWELAEINN